VTLARIIHEPAPPEELKKWSLEEFNMLLEIARTAFVREVEEEILLPEWRGRPGGIIGKPKLLGINMDLSRDIRQGPFDEGKLSRAMCDPMVPKRQDKNIMNASYGVPDIVWVCLLNPDAVATETEELRDIHLLPLTEHAKLSAGHGVYLNRCLELSYGWFEEDNFIINPEAQTLEEAFASSIWF